MGNNRGELMNVVLFVCAMFVVFLVFVPLAVICEIYDRDINRDVDRILHRFGL